MAQPEPSFTGLMAICLSKQSEPGCLFTMRTSSAAEAGDIAQEIWIGLAAIDAARSGNGMSLSQPAEIGISRRRHFDFLHPAASVDVQEPGRPQGVAFPAPPTTSSPRDLRRHAAAAATGSEQILQAGGCDLALALSKKKV
jgi:hypothetical protein